MLNGDRLSVLQDEKSSGRRPRRELPNKVILKKHSSKVESSTGFCFLLMVPLRFGQNTDEQRFTNGDLRSQHLSLLLGGVKVFLKQRRSKKAYSFAKQHVCLKWLQRYGRKEERKLVWELSSLGIASKKKQPQLSKRLLKYSSFFQPCISARSDVLDRLQRKQLTATN